MRFISFLDTGMAQVVAIVPHRRQVLFIIHIHYYGCLWPGDDGAKASAAIVMTNSTLNIPA